MVPVYRNVWERSTAKNIHPVNLLSVVSKIFEKLVNNRLFNHLEKWCLFMTFIKVSSLVSQLQIFLQLYLI